MDDERWQPGMPVLDRQPVREPRTPEPRASQAHLPLSLQGLPPRSVPEVAPTPLQAHYINLSAIALVCGFVAITALNLGAGFGHPLVKLCVLVGAPILLATTADAALRVWRSAWAWMPVNRGRALFRLAWLVACAVLMAGGVLAAVLVLLS
ncbi:MAG TPA: hypothetical protein VFK54_06090 [Candidatus Limnocylindrales bacterium]|nr:hypothetical protein [Candidatus Limnocylindrales bacterium]